MQTVRVMPWVNPEYHAYFMQGLADVFGADSIVFDPSAFKVRDSAGWYAARDTFAFLYDDIRFSVSANDFSTTNPVLLGWSDVHGTVNIRKGDAVLDDPKVVPVGPNFAFRQVSDKRVLRVLIQSVGWQEPDGWSRRALSATLRRQRQRARWSDYVATAADHRAPVFYQGTYWVAHPDANLDRLAYLCAAQETLGPDRVHGGLVANGGPLPPAAAGFASRYLAHPEYIARIKQSPFVFNHPAVHGCLGWKLGEFFALGKAIISTPVANALPGDVKHGEHWHVCDPTPDSIAEAVRYLDGHEEYRRHLERGATTYFAAELSPTRVIHRLLTVAGVAVPRPR